MVFVHVPHQSQRSQELANELRATIAGFQSRQPKTSAEEVRLALSIVTPGPPLTPARRIAVVLTSVSAVAVAGLFAALMSARENGRSVPVIAVAAGISICLAVVGVVWARVRNEE